MAAGFKHSLFYQNNGTVWSVGNNQYGQFGDGTLINKSTPVQVVGLCGQVSIKENSLEKYISIYPNPCNDKLYIEFDSNESKLINVELLDLFGNSFVVNTTECHLGENKMELNLRGLSNGLYLVRLNNMVQKIQIAK